MKKINYQLQPLGWGKYGIFVYMLMLCHVNKASGQSLPLQSNSSVSPAPSFSEIKMSSPKLSSNGSWVAPPFNSSGLSPDSGTQLNSLPRLRAVPTTHLSSIADSQSLAQWVYWHQHHLNTRPNTQPIALQAAHEKNKWKLPLFTFLYPHPKHYQYLRNEDRTFGRKAARGQLLIGGVEAIGMLVLVLMPKEVTKWEDDWMQDAGRNLSRAFTSPPVYDKDDWAINYIGHPVAGSYYYNAVRSQRASWWQSLLFATAQSFIWEYVIEGVAEQPSIQDLWITPIGGIALGEPIHQATLAMRKNGYTLFEKIVVFILNPMFVLNNGYKVPPKINQW